MRTKSLFEEMLERYGAPKAVECDSVHGRAILTFNVKTVPNPMYADGYGGLHIVKVIFNDPATIIMWSDKTKTVVHAAANESYDPEKGLAMAIAKKAMGNKGNYYNELKRWLGNQLLIEREAVDTETKEK